MILGLTVAVFLPNFEWARDANRVAGLNQNRTAADHPTHVTVDSPQLVQVGSGGLFRLFSKLQASGQSVSQSVERFPRASRCIAGIMVAASALGLLRLIYSWFFLRRVVRRSRPISDPLIVGELKEILGKMDCSLMFRLSESSVVDSAALVSCRRPHIVLPVDWREWTANERRVVFAHEAAHLVHRDGFWRLIQTLACALHAYNPFIQWLFRRGVLFQEIAADQQATMALGINVEEYLQALVKLAVRQDDRMREGRRYGSHLLAVQSEFLFRRIKMLRTMEGPHRHSLSPRTTRVTSLGWTMLLVVISLATFGLRGTAQEADVEEIRVASRESTTPSKSLESSRLFGRSKFPAGNDGTNEDGRFILRLSELAKVPGAKLFFALAESQLEAGWKESQPDMPVPDLDFSQLDYITGKATMTIHSSDRIEDKEHPNSLSFGAGLVTFRFKSPVDLPALVKKFVPDAVVESVESGTRYKINVPALGPNPMYFNMQDPQTICLRTSTPSGPFGSTSTKSTNKSAWRSAWERHEGGLLTFTASKKNIGKIVVESESDDHIAETLLQNTETYTVAADADADGKITVRLVLGCQTAAAAQAVSESYIHIAAKSIEPEQPSDHPMREFFSRKPSMVERPDGGVDVLLEYASNRTIPQLMESLLK